MTNVKILGGTLTADLAERTVSGLLIPYGEVGNTNLGKFSITPGTIEIPADPDVVTFNEVHDHERPIGRATALSDTEAGVTASFRIAKTPEGDAYLADIGNGKRRSLSAEVANVVIRAGQSVSGRLFGAAACERGAFPSAALMASDVGDLPETPTPEGAQPEDDAPEAESEDEVDETTTDAPVEATEDNATEALQASIPAGLRKNVNPAKGKGASSEPSLWAMLANEETRRATGARLNAALDQAINTDLAPTMVKTWLDETGFTGDFQPLYTPLVSHKDLTGKQAIGWKFTSGKTPTVAAYGGYPAQPASTEVKTEIVTMDSASLAGVGEVDRSYVDFPVPSFWQGYYRECANDYARKLDGIVLSGLVSGAAAVTGGTVPTGLSKAVAYLVDGAMAVISALHYQPTFAIFGQDLWRDFLLTPAVDALAYLTGALGLKEGSMGGFQVRPSFDSSLTGKVLVGSASAFTLYELPGASPIRIDTVNVANGGVQTGVFGYHAEMVNDAASLALVAAAG